MSRRRFLNSVISNNGGVIENICRVQKRKYQPDSLESLKSSDGSGNSPYFQYPVASEISFIYDNGEKLSYCGVGYESSPVPKFWVIGSTTIIGCNPAEDDKYIYKVIVE